MRVCNVTGEDWMVFALNLCRETERNVAGNVGFHQGCPQIGWQLSFADKAPWCKISVETNPNSFYLREVMKGKRQQGSKIVCRDHLCFFSTKILWQNVSPAVKICMFRLMTCRPGLLQVVNLQVKTSKGLS